MAALACAQLPGSAGACREVELIAPPARATLADPRPAFAWRERPGAAAYRLRIESAVPDGRTIASLDVRTESTRHTPDVMLAESRATVRARAWADCEGEPPSLKDAAARFLIDRRATCGEVERLRVDPRSGRLRWRAVRGADRYEVSLVDADGRIVRVPDTRRPAAAIEGSAAPAFAAVRARCGPDEGPLAVVVLVP